MSSLTDFPVPPQMLLNEPTILHRHCPPLLVKYHLLHEYINHVSRAIQMNMEDVHYLIFFRNDVAEIGS